MRNFCQINVYIQVSGMIIYDEQVREYLSLLHRGIFRFSRVCLLGPILLSLSVSREPHGGGSVIMYEGESLLS